jgi:hypothetical protein
MDEKPSLELHADISAIRIRDDAIMDCSATHARVCAIPMIPKDGGTRRARTPTGAMDDHLGALLAELVDISSVVVNDEVVSCDVKPSLVEGF